MDEQEIEELRLEQRRQIEREHDRALEEAIAEAEWNRPMTTLTITLLPSGYWLGRWNKNQWVQWPRGTWPTSEDAFGWVSAGNLGEAERLVMEIEMWRPSDE